MQQKSGRCGGTNTRWSWTAGRWKNAWEAEQPLDGAEQLLLGGKLLAIEGDDQMFERVEWPLDLFRGSWMAARLSCTAARWSSTTALWIKIVAGCRWTVVWGSWMTARLSCTAARLSWMAARWSWMAARLSGMAARGSWTGAGWGWWWPPAT